MANELETAPGTTPPGVSEAAPPPLAQPAPAPAAPIEAAPAAPAIEPAPAAPVEAKPPLTTERPSLLESAVLESTKDAPKEEAKPDAAKVEAKPAEPAKPGEAKAAEVKPADAKPAEAKLEEAKPVEPAKPVEYKFEYPATVKADSPRTEEFTSLLRESNVAPELGQKLLNMAGDAFSEFATQQSAEQHRAFNAMRDDWNKEWLADPVIGGAGHQTALKAIARMRDLLVPKEMAEPSVVIGQDATGNPIKISKFEQFLRVTGAGDHPVFARILHNAARFADEPQHESLPQNPRPVPNNGRAPGARREVLYDHPSSQRRT